MANESNVFTTCPETQPSSSTGLHLKFSLRISSAIRRRVTFIWLELHAVKSLMELRPLLIYRQRWCWLRKFEAISLRSWTRRHFPAMKWLHKRSIQELQLVKHSLAIKPEAFTRNEHCQTHFTNSAKRACHEILTIDSTPHNFSINTPSSSNADTPHCRSSWEIIWVQLTSNHQSLKVSSRARVMIWAVRLSRWASTSQLNGTFEIKIIMSIYFCGESMCNKIINRTVVEWTQPLFFSLFQFRFNWSRYKLRQLMDVTFL